MHFKFRDLVGKQFGDLTVIKYEGHNKRHFWKCKCVCGKDKTTIQEYLTTGHTTSCGCRKKRTGRNAVRFQGYEDIPLKFFNSIKRVAKKREITFSISIQQIWDLLIKQNYKCALTNRPLIFYSTDDASDGTASLDRIDSSKGYVEGNIQWVHKNINKMKMEFPQNEFIKMCKEVASHNEQ